MSGNLLIANDYHNRYSELRTHSRIAPMPLSTASATPLPEGLRLGSRTKGWSGWVSGFAPTDTASISWHELERRLLEMGFVEGARVELMHEGPIGRDPIAVRVDDLTVALRRRDADVILVTDQD